MKIFKKIAIIMIFIFVILTLTGCSDNKDETLKSKVISEIDYINVKSIDMLNKLNNISFESYSIQSNEVKLNEEEKQDRRNG